MTTMVERWLPLAEGIESISNPDVIGHRGNQFDLLNEPVVGKRDQALVSGYPRSRAPLELFWQRRLRPFVFRNHTLKVAADLPVV